MRKIDHEVNRLTSIPSGDTSKTELLKRIAVTPQESSPKEVLPRQPWPWLRYGAYLSGAAALIVVGWLRAPRGMTSLWGPALMMPPPTPTVCVVEAYGRSEHLSSPVAPSSDPMRSAEGGAARGPVGVLSPQAEASASPGLFEPQSVEQVGHTVGVTPSSPLVSWARDLDHRREALLDVPPHQQVRSA